jgi:hypothetical protein
MFRIAFRERECERRCRRSMTPYAPTFMLKADEDAPRQTSRTVAS